MNPFYSFLIGFVVGALAAFFLYRKHLVRVEQEIMNVKILMDDLKKKFNIE